MLSALDFVSRSFLERLVSEHEPADTFVDREPGVDLLHKGPHGILVGDDGTVGIYLGCDTVVLAVGDGIHDTHDAVELLLDLLRRDVLAVREDDEVLHTSREVYEASEVYIAQITGMESAVLVEQLRSQLGIVIVSGGYVIALETYLAVYDLYLVTVQHAAQRADAVMSSVVYGCHGGALGDTVALVYLDADIMEEPDDLRVECSSTADYETESAAEYLFDAGEQSVRDIDMELKEYPADVADDGKLSLLACLRHLLHDFFIDSLDDGRHYYDDGRPELLHVRPHAAHTLVDVCGAAVVE